VQHDPLQFDEGERVHAQEDRVDYNFAASNLAQGAAGRPAV
jgi:hypothetical protein